MCDALSRNTSPADANVLRSLVMRLVSDGIDAGSLSRRYLAMPGDIVRLIYRPKYRNASGAWVDAQEMTRKIGVGRPSGEQNNDPNNQRTHDIRALTIRTHVFDLPSGSPCATPQEVQDDVSVLRERMGQATISVAWDGVIHALPLPADGTLNNGLTVSAFPFYSFNAGEQHIVDANVNDAVLDVFYIEGVVHQGAPKHAVSYIKSVDQTGNPAGHNFIVMNTEEVGVPPNPPHPAAHSRLATR